MCHGEESRRASRTILRFLPHKVYDHTPMKYSYFVYILRCSDQSLYVGVTNNIERRCIEHQSGRNIACYTFSRRPLHLVFCAHYQYVQDAIAREKQLKGWSTKKKEALIRGDLDALPVLADRKTCWTVIHKMKSRFQKKVRRALGTMLRDVTSFANDVTRQHDRIVPRGVPT